MELREKIYGVTVNMLVFWAVSDLFTGIEIQEGALGYLICGGIFGLGMVMVVPLIKFFTLPVKFVSILIVSVMLSVVIFFLLNLGVPFVDFKDGSIIGLTNRYVEGPEISLNMMGNVFVGGVLSGLLSTVVDWLENGE